jgi:hypothetical protein
MSFKIHPGIGIARVGNSPEFFIGPETLEIPPPPAGGYRDSAGKIRRQAARFRVFEYDGSGTLIGEVTGQPGYTFEWTVRLRRRANPGSTTGPVLTNVRSVAGASQVALLPEIAYPIPSGASYSFGELRTDPEGRLLVLSTVDFDTMGMNGRFDGLCDGTVEVTVTGPATAGVAATTAWVFIAAPDFAPGRQPAQSFYDRLYQAYVDNGFFPTQISATPRPSFRRDVFPMLRARNQGRPLASAIESDFPLLGGIAARQGVVDSASGSYTSVTAVQEQMLGRWVGDATFPNGDFDDDWPPMGPLPLTPAELDRGAIRHCFVSGSWEMSGAVLAAGMFGAGSPHVEPFRLASTTPLLLPTLNWIMDLPACGWAPQTEMPTVGSLDGWNNRGFMILDGDDLSYVEDKDDPYVLLLTPALDFGAVQTGPGGSTAFKSLPISFEIQTGASDVALAITGSLPAGLTATSVPDVPSDSLETRHIWVSYDTSTVVSPLTGTVTVTVGTQSYEIPVSGFTTSFENTKIALAVDCSYSMTEPAGSSLTKMQVLKRALRVLIDVAREGDGLAFVPFSDDVLPTIQPVLRVGPPMGDPNRETLRDFVRDHLPIRNNTSIGDGLDGASTELAAATPGVTYANAALVIVTDGKETAGQYIAQVAARITSTTFALGIGTASNVNFGTLQTLTGNRGGYILLTGNPTSGDRRYALEKNLLQILRGATNEEIILDPPGTVVPGTSHGLEIPITEAETRFEATVVSDEASLLLLGLETPDGELIDPSALPSLPGISLTAGSRVRSLAVVLPLATPGGRSVHVGKWRLRLASQVRELPKAHSHQTHVPGRDALGQTVTYSALVSAHSAIRFRARLTQERGAFLIEATVSVFGAPPRGRTRVVAEIRGPDQIRADVVLKEAQPGRFVAEYRPIALGDYQVRVRALGQSRAAYPFVRELSLVGASLGPEDTPWNTPGVEQPNAPGDERAEPCKPKCSPASVLCKTTASVLEHWARCLKQKC